MQALITAIVILTLGSFNIKMSAQVKDSVPSRDLGEVVVNASRRFEKGDTLTIIPTANQRKFSISGYELIRSSQLPGLKVDPINGNISLFSGESVVVMIDGRPVERRDIMALRPKEVARIEYIQNPGPEYGFDTNVGALISITKKERTDGYSAAVIANNAITTANGQNYAFGKYTHGNSEISLSLNSSYVSLKKRRIDNLNLYIIEDKPNSVYFKGMNTPLKYTDNDIELEFNNFCQGRHILDISLRGAFYYSPDRAHKQMVTEDGLQPYFQLTEPYEKYIAPRLSLFYKKFLNKKSNISINFVANYRNTDYHHSVFESPTEDMSGSTDTYNYGTKSRRQAYIGEVKYYNGFSRKIRMSAGFRASYSYTSNNYTGDNTSRDRLHDTNIYAYVSANGYFGKLYYIAGLGFSGRILDQNGDYLSKWIFRPELQFSFPIGKWRFILYGVVYQGYPTLSEMGETQFRINKYELKRGNQGLDDWWSYRVQLRTTGKLGNLSIQNIIRYVTQHHPVMPSIYVESNGGETLFVNTFENQKRMSILSDRLNIEWSISNNLSLSAGGAFLHYQSRGLAYSHNLSAWQWNAQADWYAGNWNLGLSWNSSSKSLFGESVDKTGPSNTLYVNYVLGSNWRFGIAAQYLFYKNGPTMSKWLDSSNMCQYENLVVPAQGNMIFVTAAWNFSVGKTRKRVNIDLNNSDTQTGVFK